MTIYKYWKSLCNPPVPIGSITKDVHLPPTEALELISLTYFYMGSEKIECI